MDRGEEKSSEVEDITLRFRTAGQAGLLLLAVPGPGGQGLLHLSLQQGRVRVRLKLGHQATHTNIGGNEGLSLK